MRARAALVVLVLAACASDPPPAGPECREQRDCRAGEVCTAGRCIREGDPVDLDAGPSRDGPPLVLLDGGPEDAGTRDAYLDATASNDAAAPDAVPRDAGHLDAAAPDAAPGDTGPVDTGPADTGPADTGPPDAGHLDASAPDAAPPDAGPADAGPLARGAYTFRRILAPGIPSNQELTHLALSPDDATLLASARYDVLYVFDTATESSTIAVTLPKDTNESILVESIAFAPGGEWVLIAATAYVGSPSTPEARLYRAGRWLGGLVEVGTRHPGRNFQNITFDPATGGAYVIGYQQLTAGYLMTLELWDDAAGSLGFVAQDFVSAGCQDLAIADDGLGGRGRVFVCGINGAVVGVYDSTNVFAYGGNTGNTSRIAARPQGDYALAVAWSGGRLARFAQGVWTLGFGAPSLGTSSAWNIAFSSDGHRALITGQYTAGVGTLREYRHGFYATNDLSDVSIPAFGAAPWLGANGVLLDDAVWKAAGDCGYISGGCSSLTCTRGYLIAFSLLNGRPCP